MKSSLKTQDSEKNIYKWINDLGSLNGLIRLEARSQLIKVGVNAGPALIQALSRGNQHARGEAAKTLAIIRDPSAAPALVHTLEDEDLDVRCAAIEALIPLNREGLEPLLQALMRNVGSVWLREGAHNILNVLKKQTKLRQPSLNVLRALEGVEPEMTVPGVAEAAWELLFGPEKEK